MWGIKHNVSASRVVRKHFRFRLVCESKFFVIIFSFLIDKSKRFGDWANTPNPLIIVLYALFSIGIVRSFLILMFVAKFFVFIPKSHK
ncbi:hypothetical protein SAMN04487911_1588 [Arenibacter nanhaiticus]|uniref:Uncharacterized protein n=1 Tax=Arenibacter nanhaiticus TaxID=558155 RepID=A0A1M6N8N0_9FLAO|nr:hypothetical protein SAMN04487911_1588 [Arenibacter nanhaiticus]